MDDHAVRQIRLAKASADARGVGRIDAVVAGEVEGRSRRRQAGESVEQVGDALARNPIANAEECGTAAQAQIAGRRLGCRGDITAGWDDAQPRARYTLCDELLREGIARDQQQAGVSIGEAVQACLDGSAQRAVIYAPGRLVEHRDERQARPAESQPRAEKRSGDAIEDEDLGSACPGLL